MDKQNAIFKSVKIVSEMEVVPLPESMKTSVTESKRQTKYEKQKHCVKNNILGCPYKL